MDPPGLQIRGETMRRRNSSIRAVVSESHCRASVGAFYGITQPIIVPISDIMSTQVGVGSWKSGPPAGQWRYRSFRRKASHVDDR